jgi:uncharacterized protein (DUF2062 family)
MIQLTRDFVRRWLSHLLHIDDTPERTAAAFALGVFFGFSPMLGLHTILGVVFAFLLNLNRVAVLLGVYSNLPWIIGPYYAFATMVVGASITRHKIPPGFKRRSRRCSICRLSARVLAPARDAAQAVVLALRGRIDDRGAALGGVAYPLALAFVNSRKRIHDMMHHTRNQGR